ncbi:MAG: hypothetical protein V1918_00105, partial [Planctomycetota bacterium]
MPSTGEQEIVLESEAVSQRERGRRPRDAGETPQAQPPVLSQATSPPSAVEPPSATGEAATAQVPTEDEYSKLAASLALQKSENKEMLLFQCRHIRGATLKRILDNFVTSSGSVSDSDEGDMVVVIDERSNIPLLRRVAESVDQYIPQILVEARIVEVTLDQDFEKEMELALASYPTDTNVFLKQLFATIATPGPNPRTEQGGYVTIQPYYQSSHS